MNKSEKKHILLIIICFCLIVNVSANETTADTTTQGFHIGGALRYNIVTELYGGDYETPDTYITSDTWWLSVNGSKKGIDLSFEYRFYPSFGTHFIHHGYFGFFLLDSLYATLGVSQVPFGVTGFASHSWWFQGPYYVGLEDDYDIGIKFDYTGIPNTKIFGAYYRESEPEFPKFSFDKSSSNAGAGRYSYDITSSDDRTISDTSISIMELNHFHIRLTYTFKDAVTFGISGQAGEIYNKAMNSSELSTAYAGHINADIGKWNFKGQYVYYNYSAKDDQGNQLDLVPLGAYGLNYNVATECFLYVAGMSYTFNISIPPIEHIEAYIDYTLFDKTKTSFHNSYHVVPGFMVKAGNMYTYFDLAIGKNHPWLNDEFGTGIGEGIANAPWNKRLNINIGYYF